MKCVAKLVKESCNLIESQQRGFPNGRFRDVEIIYDNRELVEEKILISFFKNAPRTVWPKLLICENGRSRWDTDLAAFLGGLGYQLKTTTRTNLVFELEQKESIG